MSSHFSFGKNSLLDAINNNLEIEIVFLLDKKSFPINLLIQNNIEYQFKSKNFFNANVNNKNYQGVIFKFKTLNKLVDIDTLISDLKTKSKSLILMLDEIQDVGNLAAILRTADAFSVDAIIYKKNNQVSPFNETVVKNSVNAINFLKLCEIANLNNAIEKLKNNGFWVYVSCLEQDSIPYNQVNYDDKTVLIVGNEHKGASNLVIKNSDIKVYIPQYGHVQSLNVSVATGILLANFRNKKN